MEIKMIKEKTFKKRMSALFLMLVVVLHFILTIFTMTASAEASITSFDDTSIEEDLLNIDVSNYPANSAGECDIVSFMEFCYTNHSYYEQCYGLYVYIYNPPMQSIIPDSESNKINCLVGYDENGKSIYENVNLEYLDKTYNNLFYKFKLANSSRFLAMAREYASNNDGKRIYEFIDLQLKHSTAVIAHSNISKRYEWSGYAAYCDENNSPLSTLECKDFGVRSIHLNLKQTNYRFVPVGTICDELNSVYFEIPEEYFKDFGNLNKIKAEWYEYKTEPIFVTSDAGAYSGLWDMRGVEIDEYGKTWVTKVVDDSFVGPLAPGTNYGDTYQVYDFCGCYWRVLWEESIGAIEMDGSPSLELIWHKTYNPKCRPDIDNTKGVDLSDDWTYVDTLRWLFYVDDVTGSGGYCVSSDEVKEYIKRYTNDFPNEPVLHGKYASSLFADSIDADRIQFLENPSDKKGYVKMEFTAGEDFDEKVGNSFLDADSSQTAWNKFWFGTDYERVTYSPIVVIKEGDLYLSSSDFAKKYYVNEIDAPDIIKSAKQAYSKENRPVLLRFAVTDYYASSARFDYAEEDRFDLSEQDGYVAQETVFLEFDVISLGFQSEDGYTETVFGIVAEPIDIINGLTPPDGLVEDEDWWQKLFMLLIIILLFVALSFIFPVLKPFFKTIWKGIKAIFKALWSIITLPFTLIRQARSSGGVKRKRKRKRR